MVIPMSMYFLVTYVLLYSSSRSLFGGWFYKERYFRRPTMPVCINPDERTKYIRKPFLSSFPPHRTYYLSLILLLFTFISTHYEIHFFCPCCLRFHWCCFCQALFQTRCHPRRYPHNEGVGYYFERRGMSSMGDILHIPYL